MTPTIKVYCDKSDITEKLNGRIMSITITDELGLVSDALSLEIDNRDDALAIPPRGAELEAFIGYKDLYPMGKFVVDEIELKGPPATMLITARASDSTLRDMGAYLSPRSKSWENTPLKTIIQTIASRYGLSAAIAPEFVDTMIVHEDQADESDSAFIQRVAENHGAIVKVANGKIFFMEPLSGKFPDGTPIPITTIKSDDICDYTMRLTERGKYGKVVAKYYDFDMAKERQVSVGASSPIFTLRETFISPRTARARAKAKLADIEQGTKTLSLNMVGNPLLAAESRITIVGLSGEFAGNWIVKSTKHTISSSGYTTAVEAISKGDAL